MEAPRAVPIETVVGRLVGVGLIAVFVSWTASPAAAAPPAGPVFDLTGEWRLHAGELAVSPADVFRADFDASSWSVVPVPGPFVRSGSAVSEQSGWFRRVIELEGSRAPVSGPLGLALGRVNSAYEVWIDGHRLGGVGRLPDSAGGSGAGEVDYDRQVVWPVPPSVVADGRLVIALHV